MIYPLVIHPDVFHSLYEKDEIPKNIKNFFYKIIYNDYQKEKFFFIDDTNETLKNVSIARYTKYITRMEKSFTQHRNFYRTTQLNISKYRSRKHTPLPTQRNWITLFRYFHFTR